MSTTGTPSESEQGKGKLFETDLPARLDRLPWGRFHTLLVFALGITWLLDGLEVTLAGSVSGALKESPVLRLKCRYRSGGRRVHHRCGAWCAVLWLAD
jgi:hypothetical protein